MSTAGNASCLASGWVGESIFVATASLEDEGFAEAIALVVEEVLAGFSDLFFANAADVSLIEF